MVVAVRNSARDFFRAKISTIGRTSLIHRACRTYRILAANPGACANLIQSRMVYLLNLHCRRGPRLEDAWLKVQHGGLFEYGPRILHELLVYRILEAVIVSIFFILKFHDKAMRESILEIISSKATRETHQIHA